MSLNLSPDIEARLLALAQSSGVPVEDFLLHVVEERPRTLWRCGSILSNGPNSSRHGPTASRKALRCRIRH